jgi:colanic acid/amylovoran biosynthesis protein
MIRSSTPMRRRAHSALIINAYSAKNAGDAAIVLATAALLKSRGIGQVANATRYYADDRPFYESRDITVTPPIVPLPERGLLGDAARLQRFAIGLAAAGIITSIYRIRPSSGRRLAIKARLLGLVAAMDASCIVICGGGYMYSSRRRVNLSLVHSLVTILLSSFLGKPLVMMPQSVGPLSKRFDRWLTRLTLRRVEPIVARDSDAVKEVESIFVRRANTVTLCPDIAFHGWDAIRRHPTPRGIGRTAIGIVVMDWTWARQVDSELALGHYIRKIADTTTMLSRQGFKVNLLGHSRLPEHDQDDLAVANQVVKAVTHTGGEPPAVIDLDSDPERLSNFFADLLAIVGTRLHSCILSMVSGTPAIALAYQPKSLGTYELLGLGELCFDVEHFTAEQLTIAIAQVVSEGSTLSARVDAAVNEAHEKIVALYGRSLSDLA